MDPHWARLVDFARSHDGVITWAEAAAVGIPPQRLQGWHRGGRLRRPAPQVYVVAGVPDTWHQRVRVATGSGRPGRHTAPLPPCGASKVSTVARSRW